MKSIICLVLLVGLVGMSVPASALDAAPSRIVFSFADGKEGIAFRGYPTLASHGLRGVAFVPTGLIGKAGRMTVQQVIALDAAGWDVASHLDSGGDSTAMPPEELSRRLLASHNWLDGYGLGGAVIFGPPAQRWAPDLTPLAVAAGYSAIIVPQERGGLIPQGLVPVYRGCANAVSLDAIASAIRRAQATPGQLLLLSFHNIVAANPTGTDADVARLEAVVHLAIASGVPLGVVSDLMGEVGE
jgi:peptidoglycan/xylan/chitin deacetylase (PgdA/CDA1 family)